MGGPGKAEGMTLHIPAYHSFLPIVETASKPHASYREIYFALMSLGCATPADTAKELMRESVDADLQKARQELNDIKHALVVEKAALAGMRSVTAYNGGSRMMAEAILARLYGLKAERRAEKLGEILAALTRGRAPHDIERAADSVPVPGVQDTLKALLPLAESRVEDMQEEAELLDSGLIPAVEEPVQDIKARTEAAAKVVADAKALLLLEQAAEG